MDFFLVVNDQIFLHGLGSCIHNLKAGNRIRFGGSKDSTCRFLAEEALGMSGSLEMSSEVVSAAK